MNACKNRIFSNHISIVKTYTKKEIFLFIYILKHQNTINSIFLCYFSCIHLTIKEKHPFHDNSLPLWYSHFAHFWYIIIIFENRAKNCLRYIQTLYVVLMIFVIMVTDIEYLISTYHFPEIILEVVNPLCRAWWWCRH